MLKELEAERGESAAGGARGEAMSSSARAGLLLRERWLPWVSTKVLLPVEDEEVQQEQRKGT